MEDKEIIVEFGEIDIKKHVLPYINEEDIKSLIAKCATPNYSDKVEVWKTVFEKLPSPKHFMLAWYLNDPNLEHLPEFMTSYGEVKNSTPEFKLKN